MRLPKVTCLCVTDGRHEMFDRALMAYYAQRYPEKNMVVVYRSDDSATRHILNRASDDVLGIEVPRDKQITLGDLRNIAVEWASGEYVCHWDDDDLYHEDRIVLQMEELIKTGMIGCVLSSVLIFDVRRRAAYLSRIRAWEQTLICLRSAVISRKYPSIDRGEDSPIVKYLRWSDNLCYLSAPYAYVYCCHGSNVSGESHFEKIMQSSTPLAKEENGLIMDAFSVGNIRESPSGLSSIDWERFDLNGKVGQR